MDKPKLTVVENVKEFKSEDQKLHDRSIASMRQSLASAKASDVPVVGVCTLLVYADGTTRRYSAVDYMWVVMVGALHIAATRLIATQEPVDVEDVTLTDEDE